MAFILMQTGKKTLLIASANGFLQKKNENILNKIKADATVKGGVRLFFGLKKSGYANHSFAQIKNINWYIIFAGVVSGGNFAVGTAF